MGAHWVLSSNKGWDRVPEFVARLRPASGRFPLYRGSGDPARSAQGLDGSKGIALRAFRSSRSSRLWGDCAWRNDNQMYLTTSRRFAVGLVEETDEFLSRW